MAVTPRASTLILGTVAALSCAVAAQADDRAVVVGIDDYTGIAMVRPLTQARADAERFRAHLIQDQGFAPENVTLLTDADATSTAIIEALFDDLVAGTSPGDRAVFYFAGLGGRVADPDGTEMDSYEEYLLAHGADNPFSLIPESAFVEVFDTIGDRDVTLIIDAAMTAPRASVLQDGDAVAARAAEFGQISPATRNVSVNDLGPIGEATFMESPFGSGAVNRTIWVASAPSQVAWESMQGGVFTDAYIDGISEATADLNDNGIVTNAELLVHLRETSEDWCAGVQTCNDTGLGLTPDFSGDVMAVAAMVGGDDSGNAVPFTAPEPAAEISTTENVEAFITDLFAASNDAGIAISMSEAGHLTLGETVRFFVESNRPGTLLLLDVNPSGELFQIFPSRLSMADAARIEAGQRLIIPEAVATTGRPLQIRVTEPIGPGFLIALLVESDVPIYEQLLPQNLNLDPIPDATQYLYEVAQTLLEMQAGPDGNAAVEWSAAYLPYTIVE
jgi:hypothetical protein